MPVYYRKRKLVPAIKKQESLVGKGIDFLKSYLYERIEEASDDVERKVRKALRQGSSRRF